jgi:5-methylcytosine-specific restriction endonuclease McrA
MEHNSVGAVLRRNIREIVSRAQERNQVGVRKMRSRSKTVDGQQFSGLEKVAVWLNALPVTGKDSRLWRQDPCGALMRWGDYGNCKSKWGWEVDHVIPVALGGTDAIDNLQALHWKNNRHKGDRMDDNYCVTPLGVQD